MNQERTSFQNKLDNANLEFAKERQDLKNQLSDHILIEDELRTRIIHLESNVKELKEELEMTREINKQTIEEISEDVVDRSQYLQLDSSLKKVQAMLEERNLQLDDYRENTQKLNSEITRLKLQIVNEEGFKSSLKHEIVSLKSKYSDLEEAFNKEKIEGNAHIGLSKIDFSVSKYPRESAFPGQNLSKIDEIDYSGISQLQIKPSNFSIRSSAKPSIRHKQNFPLVHLKRDYLNALSTEKVEFFLNKYGDTVQNGTAMSDFLLLYNSKLSKTRMRMLITSQSIYVFNKNWQILRRYSICSLVSIIISEKDYSLMLLRFNKGYDMLVESYRRLDIILYLGELVKRNCDTGFSIKVKKRFHLDVKGKNKEVSAAKIKKNTKKDVKVEETIRNSKKSGFMKIRKRWFFGKSMKEYFFLLCDLGLIYFKNYGVSSSI